MSLGFRVSFCTARRKSRGIVGRITFVAAGRGRRPDGRPIKYSLPPHTSKAAGAVVISRGKGIATTRREGVRWWRLFRPAKKTGVGRAVGAFAACLGLAGGVRAEQKAGRQAGASAT